MQQLISMPETPADAVEPNTPESQPPRRRDRRTALMLVAAAVVGGIAGFGASALHPGAQGKPGAIGPAGSAGPQGPAGSAAGVSGLGVCYQTYSNSNSGVSWMTGVSISAPAKHADGTTYCAYGDYVSVSPQPENGPPGE